MPENLITLVSDRLEDADDVMMADGSGGLPTKRSSQSLRYWLSSPAANAAVQLCKKVFVGNR